MEIIIKVKNIEPGNTITGIIREVAEVLETDAMIIEKMVNKKYSHCSLKATRCDVDIDVVQPPVPYNFQQQTNQQTSHWSL